MVRFLGFAVLAAVSLGIVPNSQAALIFFTAHLDGPSEAPPNASPGTGFAQVIFDTVAHTMSVEASFSDLIGTTTAAHIHAPTAVQLAGTAGVATTTPNFPSFPLGVTSGNFSNTFDMTLASSYNPNFIIANGGTTAGAEAVLLNALLQKRAYFNIHTNFVPAGEIRGFLQPVPEPTTVSIVGFGGICLLLARRRARR